ncbi:hypothetical protein [Agreia sp. COWG]|uniref:hypothetical protein n=1 Tax=Agreia sp. COWG TaxID=2773266 RepID=UPI001AF4525A|nr:hypothetical protein [Agreia sp. COWG]CAD5991005.1 protein of unknown function [Agreia sp. COWG]
MRDFVTPPTVTPSLRTISREDASSRITAYVYGNIVALATVASLTGSDAEKGTSFWYVLATSFPPSLSVWPGSPSCRGLFRRSRCLATSWGDLR